MTTIPAAPPAPTEKPNRDAVDSWSLTSMQHYLDLLTRHSVADAAARADRIIAAGASYPSRYGDPHVDVMLALAAAEGGALPDERYLHAARTDTYAALHGLKGWHRYTNWHGEHRVAVNKLRGPDDGDVGRYFYYTPSTVAYPKVWAVIDRDTGAVVARAPEQEIANEWIARTAASVVDDRAEVAA